MAPKGEITELEVQFVSLVKRPATGKGLVLKSDHDHRTFEIVKTDDERQVAYGIVYPVGEEDSHGNYASAQVIERAAYRFIRAGRAESVDTEHDFIVKDAYVGESWLVRKGDPLFPDESEGSWAVGIKVLDPDLWKAVKAGELTGISMYGFGLVDEDKEEEPIKKDQDGLFAELLRYFKREKSMALDDKDLEAIADKVAAKLQKADGDGGDKDDADKGGDGGDKGGDQAGSTTNKELAEAVTAIGKTVETLSAAVTELAKAKAPGSDEGGAAGSGSAESQAFI